jgi:hypothetical protein
MRIAGRHILTADIEHVEVAKKRLGSHREGITEILDGFTERAIHLVDLCLARLLDVLPAAIS